MSRSDLAVLLAARASVEAAVLALVLAAVGPSVGGAPELLRSWLGLGGMLVAVAAGALAFESRARRSAVAAAGVVAAVVAAALSAPADTDLVRLGARLVAGALLGAVVVWRGVAVAETLASWRATAVSAMLALVAIAAASLAPLDGRALIAIAVVAALLSAVGLSVARSTEELLMAERARGRSEKGAPLAAAALVGCGAIAAAAEFGVVSDAVGVAASLLDPIARELLLLVVTPFVYLADWLVRALLPLLQSISIHNPFLQGLGGDRQDDAEYARQVSLRATAFLQSVVVVVVAIVVVALVLRAVLARRGALSFGVMLDRERIGGPGLAELLTSLLRRPRAARPPRPHGADAATRVRRAYWDLLALAERAGAGWRPPQRTPREHAAELDAALRAPAETVVAAFERARYAERASDEDAAEAERAVAAVKRALAARA